LTANATLDSSRADSTRSLFESEFMVRDPAKAVEFHRRDREEHEVRVIQSLAEEIGKQAESRSNGNRCMSAIGLCVEEKSIPANTNPAVCA
jgi:hypothetical protein